VHSLFIQEKSKLFSREFLFTFLHISDNKIFKYSYTLYRAWFIYISNNPQSKEYDSQNNFLLNLIIASLYNAIKPISLYKDNLKLRKSTINKGSM